MVLFLSSSLVLPPLYTRRVRKESGDEGSDSGKERDDCRDEEKLMTNLSIILIGEKTALQ